MDATELLVAQNALIKQQNKLLSQLLNHSIKQNALLTQIALATQEREPGYRRQLTEYARFDWNSIGAVVLDRDESGPTKVEWGGHQWLRRHANQSKYGSAIWYSRHVSGSGENVKYYELIKFVDKMDVEKMPVSMPRQPEPTQSQPKDWRSDAISSTDEWMFDTAYQKHKEYFKKHEDVASARKAICGEWHDGADVQYTTAVCDALDFYVERITELKEQRKEDPSLKINGSAILVRAQQKFEEWHDAVRN